MSKINTYPAATPVVADKLVGTDVSNTSNDAGGETVNFLISALDTLLSATTKTLTNKTLVSPTITGTGTASFGKVSTGDAGELTIASGVITVTGSYHRVDTEADAASDDVDTINGGVDGQRVILRPAVNARTIVMKDATDNLRLEGDFTMDNQYDNIELLYDSTGSVWIEVSRSNTGA